MEFYFSFWSLLDKEDFAVLCFSRLQKLVGELNCPRENHFESDFLNSIFAQEQILHKVKLKLDIVVFTEFPIMLKLPSQLY
jgi:hypothetical protein